MSPASDSRPHPIVCPACASDNGRWLKQTSLYATVNYFRCEDCGHVWWIDKRDPAQKGDVTERERR